jgi:ABC-type glycerol-3-phosphate transport system substrate-binding protein
MPKTLSLIRRIIAAVALVAVTILVFMRSGIVLSWRQELEQLAQPGEPPIELRIWDWWSPATNEAYAEYFDTLKERFEATHPGVRIRYQFVPFISYVQKLSTGMTGANPPDVFQCSVAWVDSFYNRGMLLPLNEQLKEQNIEGGPQDLGRNAFIPSAWRHNEMDNGHVVGIPQTVDAACLLWNLDILEQALEQYPDMREMFQRKPDGSLDTARIHFDAIRDWEHFRQLTKRLTVRDKDGNLEQAGYAIVAKDDESVFALPWFAANGGGYEDPAGRKAIFARPAGVQAMHFLGQLYWEDKVCPTIQRQLMPVEVFERRDLVCVSAGTWDGKKILRNTQGWSHFGMTAYPAGPMGDGPGAVTWANMMVLSRRSKHPDLAWDYIKLTCGLEGNLIRLKLFGYAGPRKDLYNQPEWDKAVEERAYLSNVPKIAAVGSKLRRIEVAAADHQANPIFESIILNYPSIVAGEGPYPSVKAALEEAAGRVNRVFDTYHHQVAEWRELFGFPMPADLQEDTQTMNDSVRHPGDTEALATETVH